MSRKDHRPQAKRAGGLAERIRSRLARARRGISYTFSAEHLRELFCARSFKAGGYTAVSCVFVIAIAAVAVVVAESLPSTYTAIDISRDQTTSISDETRDYLADLDEDVEIYLIAEEGAQDEYLELLLDDYAAASERVKVEQVDPTLHPTFTDQYTSDEVADGSLIVVCGDESRVVTSSELYSINYATYSYEFAGESAITGAITALTSEDLPHVYLLSGHGEASLPQTVSSTLESVDYGLDEPTLVATLDYVTQTTENVGDTNDDGYDDYETVETPGTFVLVVGDKVDGASAYYAQPRGSSKVYTVWAASVEDLLDVALEALRPDDVLLMEWTTVDSIDVTADGATKIIGLEHEQTETDEDGGGELDVETTYTVDGAEADAGDVEALLGALDALASEGVDDTAEPGEAEVTLVFRRNTDTFSEMTFALSRYDNSFYLLSFDGASRLLINRQDVEELRELIDAL